MEEKLSHLEADTKEKWRQWMLEYRDSFWVEGDELGFFKERTVDAAYDTNLPPLGPQRQRFYPKLRAHIEEHVSEMFTLSIIKPAAAPKVLSPFLLVINLMGRIEQ